LFEKILAIDAKPAGQTKIKVNRLKASKFIEKGKADNTGECLLIFFFLMKNIFIIKKILYLVKYSLISKMKDIIHLK